MTLKGSASKAAIVLGAGVLFAATPLALHKGPNGVHFSAIHAFAKDGGDDRGGDDHGDDHGGNSGSGSGGRGGEDHGSDDHSGSGGSGGDRGGDDDSSGSGSGSGGHGSDDGSSDDHGSGGHGSDDSGFDDRGGDSRGVDDSARGDIEVVRADGTKEEISNGWYERQDASGRTVEERRATSADIARLTGPDSTGRRTIAVGYVKTVEARGGNIEIRYSTGWTEELQGGRYELTDPNDNTVVERPARPADIARLQALANH